MFIHVEDLYNLDVKLEIPYNFTARMLLARLNAEYQLETKSSTLYIEGKALKLDEFIRPEMFTTDDHYIALLDREKFNEKSFPSVEGSFLQTMNYFGEVQYIERRIPFELAAVHRLAGFNNLLAESGFRFSPGRRYLIENRNRFDDMEERRFIRGPHGPIINYGLLHRHLFFGDIAASDSDSGDEGLRPLGQLSIPQAFNSTRNEIDEISNIIDDDGLPDLLDNSIALLGGTTSDDNDMSDSDGHSNSEEILDDLDDDDNDNDDELELPPIQIQQEDLEAINRLVRMGFSRENVVHAYFMSNRNEQIAHQLLISRNFH